MTSNAELAMETKAIALPFVDGLELVVPDNIQVMTPYVLQEQHDWFEIEAAFVRKILEPGMQVIDVGANFGVYAIPMASCIGEYGNLWAFEPCRSTFDHLVQSVKRNSIHNITLIRSGLGERQGIVRLATSDDAELNAITSDVNASGEIIDLTTLDTCMAELNITDVDFIKLDAEGYEDKVLQGGEKLLRKFEPLVMFELRHNDTVNLSLIEDFQNLGMQPFVLTPGAGVLVPFDPDADLDLFRLNLFACSSGRAEKLRSQGYLVTDDDIANAPDLTLDHARQHLTTVASNLELPLVEVRKIQAGEETPLVEDLLLCLAVELGSGSPAARVATLRGIVAKYRKSVLQDDDIPGLALLARCAQHLGEQHLCVTSAIRALEVLKTGKTRPQLMLGALPQFDLHSPGSRFHEWLVSGFLECFEKSRAFSSFMHGEESLQNLQILCDMGFSGDEMHRRIALIKRRFGHANATHSNGIESGQLNQTQHAHNATGQHVRSA